MTDKYVLCICEGNFEIAIMELLLEAGLLPFNKEQLINEKFIKRSSVANISRRYLSRNFDKPVYIIRIVDSKTERFVLSKEYSIKIEQIINIITKPEVEILVIISEGDYQRYSNSNPSRRKSASEHCKSKYNMRNIKSSEFVKSYFNDTKKLLQAISTYHSYRKNDGYSLMDLIYNKMNI